MRNLLNITSTSEHSYFSVIKNIANIISDVQTITPEGQIFIENTFTRFNEEIIKNGAPLLYIAGNDKKIEYQKFEELDPTITQLAKSIATLINGGDFSCLINICAEEHYLNTGAIAEWLEPELNGSSEQVKQLILQDVYAGLNSTLYEKIKEDLIQGGAISIDETADTYHNVISKIKNYIVTVTPDTTDGQKFLNESITKIFESKTPLLELREFKTNAQQVVGHDVKLMDVVKFINKNVKDSPTLNVLINLAKEEHIQENLRANQPAEDDTIKALEKYWQAGNSEIEQAIKNGIFDKLKSNLIMDLKSDLIPDAKNTPIVEITKKGPTMEKLLEAVQDVVVFNPIGVLWEDKQNSQQYAFIGQEVLQLQEIDNEADYIRIDAPLNKPENLNKILLALDSLSYDPQTQRFSTSLDIWDFNIVIESDGKISLINPDSVVQVNKEDLQELFGETLTMLSQNLSYSQIDLNQFKKDADNFILIAYNFDKLIMFDDLYQIQSLNENTFVILNESVFEDNNTQLKIIAGTTSKETKSFKSYNELVFELHKNIGLKSEKSINSIFNYHLSNENTKLFERQNRIGQLKAIQETLNKEITDKSNLLKIAEQDSPAYERLNSEIEKLSNELDSNLSELNTLINNYDVLTH